MAEGFFRGRKGYFLLEVTAAAAVIALAATALLGALLAAEQIALTARAVTRGRLLAKAHLEMARAGKAPAVLHRDGLTSTLTVLDWGGSELWQVEVEGDHLFRNLTVVSGP